MSDAAQSIMDFILSEFLQGEDPRNLTLQTPLVSGGILDSMAILRLASFIEEKFGVVIEPHEMDAEHMETVERLSHLLGRKLAS